MTYSNKFLVGKSLGSDVGIDERIIIKWILNSK
jgi:hypothetical protein